jgi:hypothetical protein
MTADQFVTKWTNVELSERAASYWYNAAGSFKHD